MSWSQVIATCLCYMLAADALAQEAGDPGKGLLYALETCAGCHGVQAADRISPRPGTATFKLIANTPGMTGIAISAWLQTPHKSMPDLIIAAEDRRNVIAYILSLRNEPMPR